MSWLILAALKPLVRKACRTSKSLPSTTFRRRHSSWDGPGMALSREGTAHVPSYGIFRMPHHRSDQPVCKALWVHVPHSKAFPWTLSLRRGSWRRWSPPFPQTALRFFRPSYIPQCGMLQHPTRKSCLDNCIAASAFGLPPNFSSGAWPLPCIRTEPGSSS